MKKYCAYCVYCKEIITGEHYHFFCRVNKAETRIKGSCLRWSDYDKKAGAAETAESVKDDLESALGELETISHLNSLLSECESYLENAVEKLKRFIEKEEGNN